MQNHLPKFIPAALLALGLSSCLEVDQTVNLKKDGSGTIVEEVVMGAQISQMLGSLAALGGEDAKAPDMFSEENSEKRAEKFGKGVSVAKVEKIDKDGRTGAKTTYTFTDINTVQLSMSNSTSALEEMAPQGAAAEAKAEDKPFSFTYKDGLLTVNNPAAEPAKIDGDEAKKKLDELKEKLPEGADEDATPEGDPMQAMMMESMKDMRISLKINIVDGISETNATHHKDNTVTIMEMDFGKLMENPEIAKNLTDLNIQDPAAMQEKLANIEGVKAETKKVITIKVK